MEKSKIEQLEPQVVPASGYDMKVALTEKEPEVRRYSVDDVFGLSKIMKESKRPQNVYQNVKYSPEVI